MAIGDKIKGFFANVKDRFTTIGEKIRDRVEQAGTKIGEIIRKAPAGIESAVAFVGKQAVTLSKSVGEVGYNVISGSGKGLSETVGNTLNSSIFSGPVILGGLALGALIATKIM